LDQHAHNNETAAVISYDPKNWLKVTFSYGGTPIPRVLWRVMFLAVLTAALLLLRELWPQVEPVFKPFKPLGHTLIGVALGLLIVFRNNSSYDRYWEGRKLWGGIVNAARNLVRGAAAYVGEVNELPNLVAAYALALKQHLRSNKDLSEVQPLVSAAVYEQVAAAANPPSLLAFQLSAWIQARASAGKMDSITAQTLEGYVRTFLDCQGGCERILRTPIPFAYAAHIKQLLTLYLITLPFILIGEMSWFAIPTVAAIAFGLLGIEEAGVEIEDPFGDDPNDLPVEAMCATIARDTTALAEAAKTAGRPSS
jgi:ion channel-forming bestrophin family protein